MALKVSIANDPVSRRFVFNDTPFGTLVKASRVYNESLFNVWMRGKTQWICLTDGYTYDDNPNNPSAYIEGVEIKEVTLKQE